ncbi:MAG: hypothetical protein WDN04_17105 [Rhodospirillales bacterium]
MPAEPRPSPFPADGRMGMSIRHCACLRIFRLLAPPDSPPMLAGNDPGRSDRARPVFIIAGTATSPITDVTLSGLRLQGNFAAGADRHS